MTFPLLIGAETDLRCTVATPLAGEESTGRLEGHLSRGRNFVVQLLTTYLVGKDKRMVRTPNAVTIETDDGRLLDRLDELREAFKGC